MENTISCKIIICVYTTNLTIHFVIFIDTLFVNIFLKLKNILWYINTRFYFIFLYAK